MMLKNMKLEILLSCMFQNCWRDIVEKANIESAALIINQCDSEEIVEADYKDKEIRFYKTKTRGLSLSRNMAISSASGDICLFADDDEVFSKDYPDIIKLAFQKNPEADIILFKLKRPDKRYPNRKLKIGYVNSLMFCSCQIAFKRDVLIKKNIFFDINMGSGTGNGGGEDNKFLFDCLSAGLCIIYVPIEIASVAQTESKWFQGYTHKYFYERGWVNRKIMGPYLAILYAFEFALTKFFQYRQTSSFGEALIFQIKGVLSKTYPSERFKEK